MKLENVFRKGRSVLVGGVEVQFDENGLAETDDTTGAALLMLAGYRAPGKAAPVEQSLQAVDIPDEDVPLSSMNPAQLKKLAKEKGIDVGDATKKADLIALIEQA